MKKMIWVVWVVGVILISSGTVLAEVGVTNNEIIVGQSAALEGPTKALGQGMKNGMHAYFAYINDRGGVKGRKIKLVSYDDGYEPVNCIEQTRRLITEGVFCLIGYVGTPTAKAAVPIAEQEKVLFVGPFTGAEFLRNPVKHYVINIRGSYFDETEGLVQRLVTDLGIKSIACFYQNDSYGQAGLEGVSRALDKRNLSLVAEGTYERNTVAVKGGLARIKTAEPEAVIMIGAYEPCSEFIKLAKQIGMTKAIFCNISFVGSDSLKESLGSDGEGVIISQVVPFPWDMSIPLVEEYHRLIKQYSPEQKPGFVSLEGFMVAKFFVQALEACGPDVTREGVIAAVESKGSFDLGGLRMTFGKNDHQGMDTITFTKIEGGELKSITTFK
ncbi:MAG: ABC transporter substrate-binding protein [Candidatus Omnitrophica bacterium]|nr:ABC transporter substrate-binding protein [Candidatus Omnitrophota bacterium]MBU4478455.1 ABC transporter substrate-binding protein [Candidatus Omnitrophota bacterium]MCG2702947.1 ABC transporter substrate-binding protein [Candidatus Omnitrophota bacterium]